MARGWPPRRWRRVSSVPTAPGLPSRPRAQGISHCRWLQKALLPVARGPSFAGWLRGFPLCQWLRVSLNSQVAFGLQLGDASFHAAQSRRLTGFAGPVPSPLPRHPCAPAPLPEWVFWRGRPAGSRGSVLVCAVATLTLWVTASARGSKLPIAPDSARTRFLIAPRLLAPTVMLLTGHDTGQRSW